MQALTVSITKLGNTTTQTSRAFSMAKVSLLLEKVIQKSERVAACAELQAALTAVHQVDVSLARCWGIILIVKRIADYICMLLVSKWSKNMYMLAPPPNDPSKFKEGELLCWAAGLASLINVAKLGNWSTQQAHNNFILYENADGSLPETGGAPDQDGKSGGIGAVYIQLGVYTTSIDCATFTTGYILDKLQHKGHVIVMYQWNGNMGHTQVAYGAGYPSDDYISVFDPMSDATDYQNIPVSQVSGSGLRMYVGWANWAGP